MNYKLTKKDRLVALKIVTIYASFSGLWIYMSDHLLGLVVRDPAVLVRYSVLKGLFFIAITVCLLYHLIARYTKQCRQAEEALKELNEVLEVKVAERTEELERQNKELQETYLGLEEETTKRINAVEELRNKEQMLMQQRRMAAMGEMLVNIAHHWRQPLNVVGLKIQEIGLIYDLGGFDKTFLDKNISDSMEILQQLSKTIDDFRAIALEEREKTIFSVCEVVTNVLSINQRYFTEMGITIKVICRCYSQIHGYQNEFKHALIDILMNARDAFVERKTTEAAITVKSWAEKGTAIVTITDNAGGIKEDVIERIFEPYFTTKETGKGSGLRLFMAQTLIEKNMGGRLSVRNVEGGAEFRIEVPERGPQ